MRVKAALLLTALSFHVCARLSSGFLGGLRVLYCFRSREVRKPPGSIEGVKKSDIKFEDVHGGAQTRVFGILFLDTRPTRGQIRATRLG